MERLIRAFEQMFRPALAIIKHHCDLASDGDQILLATPVRMATSAHPGRYIMDEEEPLWLERQSATDFGEAKRTAFVTNRFYC